MNIPDETVEASARAAYEVKPVELFGRDKPVTWEQLSDSPLGQRRKDNELTKARLILEAATPNILAADRAEVWAEGHEVGFWNGRMTLGDTSDVALIGKGHADAINPYRKQQTP